MIDSNFDKYCLKKYFLKYVVYVIQALICIESFGDSNDIALEYPLDLQLKKKIIDKVTHVIEDIDLYRFDKKLLKNITIGKVVVDVPNYMKTVKCQVGEIAIRVEIDEMRIVEIINGYAKKKIEEKNLFNDNHKKTYDEVLTIGKNFVAKVLGALPENVEQDVQLAKSNMLITYGDLWSIKWRRFTGQYFYPRDIILVQISEAYGLVEYRNQLASNEIDEVIDIDSVRAIQIAKNNINEIVKEYNKHKTEIFAPKAIDKYKYDSVSIQDKPCIVNKGIIMPWYISEPRISPRKLEVHLVWPILFKSDIVNFEVYIDTKNGGIVGFNYFHREK